MSTFYAMERNVQLKADGEKYNLYLPEAVKYGENIQDYVSIISGEMHEVKTNKYIFSLFSLGLSPALFNTCVSPTLLFPDCSTLSLQHLINIITTGYLSLIHI